MNLQVEPSRLGCIPSTGIYVRAQHHDQWMSVDITELTRESLLAWLSEKQAVHPYYAINVVLILLGHEAKA